MPTIIILFHKYGKRPEPWNRIFSNPDSAIRADRVFLLKNFIWPPSNKGLRCLSHPSVIESIKFFM